MDGEVDGIAVGGGHGGELGCYEGKGEAVVVVCEGDVGGAFGGTTVGKVEGCEGEGEMEEVGGWVGEGEFGVGDLVSGGAGVP